MDQSRRAVLKGIGAGTALAVAGVGAASAREGASGDQTIVDIAAADDRFDTLVAALQETGLDAVLANEDDQFTVFAPTDSAFGNLGVNEENVGDIDFEAAVGASLSEILLYHVTDGRRYARSVVNVEEIEMLNGETVTVDGTTLNDGQAGIIATNIEASNGIIHVIDGSNVDGAGVLLP